MFIPKRFKQSYFYTIIIKNRPITECLMFETNAIKFCLPALQKFYENYIHVGPITYVKNGKN